MTRAQAVALATDDLDAGRFGATLARLVAIPSESQDPDRAPELARYLREGVRPLLDGLGFACRILEHPGAAGPFLYAERLEDPTFTTVLGYGHGDVTRGQAEAWAPGLSPWTLTERDGRWYGRGAADNKGQHLVNLTAQAAVLAARGRLGFNAKWLIETGEEVGSPGLREVCRENRDLLGADLLVASDGPRLAPGRPTIFLGARGGASFDLSIDAREGAHHSGNWGGLLSNPAIQLCHAIAALVGPTGAVLVPALTPKGGIPSAVRRALADCPLEEEPGSPAIVPGWGEPGLTGPEKVFGWSSLEILAMTAGRPEAPVNAIPGRAWARCQLRFPVGVAVPDILPAVRARLDAAGLGFVRAEPAREETFPATRLDPDDPWVRRAAASLAATAGRPPAILPNLGGSLPNDAFSDILGLPTIWVPHSYAGCSQHAPDEHLPIAIAREGLALMTGLYWDLGEAE